MISSVLNIKVILKIDNFSRNVVLVNTAARRVDPLAGELYHLLLQLLRQAQSPLTAFDISHAAKKKFGSGSIVDYCEQYLQVLGKCFFMFFISNSPGCQH